MVLFRTAVKSLRLEHSKKWAGEKKYHKEGDGLQK